MSYDKALVSHKLLRWEHYLNNYRLPAWKELPDIGLYMDQVIALLGQYLDFIPVEDMKNEKPVAPTTINNYVRLKVMPAPEKRKYYRIHIAFLIMIFTLKQGTSISGLQQLLPGPEASEEEVRAFYASYIERLNFVSTLYTAQVRSFAQEALDPQHGGDEVVENLVIQSILNSALSRIMGEKLLRLRGADPEKVLEQEKLNDARGLHPMIPPLEGEG
jgi:hypothetical protein